MPTLPLKALYLSDSNDGVKFISKTLGLCGFKVDLSAVSSIDGMRGALHDNNEWDMAFSDHSSKGFSSSEALQAIL